MVKVFERFVYLPRSYQRILQRQSASGGLCIMNIHEYQAKEMFREFGVNVLEGVHCKSVDEAVEAYDSLESEIVP